MGHRYFDSDREQASYWYDLAMKNKYIPAFYNMGILFKKHKEYEQADNHFKMVPDYSNFELGNLYRYGQGVPKDITLTIKYYIQAYDNGNEDVPLILANIYRYDLKDYGSALMWYQRCSSDVNEAILELYSSNKLNDPISYMKLTEQLATAGDPVHQYQMAKLYSKGSLDHWKDLVPIDEKRGFTWLELVVQHADQSNYTVKTAYIDLGISYDSGIEVPINKAKAVELLTKVKDYSRAQFYLGKIAYHNNDYDEAFKWYSLSSANGCEYGHHELGVCYYLGHGTPIDYDKARKCYLKAGDLPDAYTNLGISTNLGLGSIRIIKPPLIITLRARPKGN